MFKLFLFICLIFAIALKVNSDLQSETEELTNKLKDEVAEKVKSFHKLTLNWLNELFDTVSILIESEESDLKNKLNKIDDDIKDLKRIKPECVDKYKKEIANLESIGNSFSTCSREINNGTLTKVRLILNKVENIQAKTNSYDKQLVDCAQQLNCIQNLLDNLKTDVKKLPAELVKHIHATRDMIEGKMNNLDNCLSVQKMWNEALEIFQQIKSCSP